MRKRGRPGGENECSGGWDKAWGKKEFKKPFPAHDFNSYHRTTRTEYEDNFNIKMYANTSYYKNKSFIDPTQNELNCTKRNLLMVGQFGIDAKTAKDVLGEKKEAMARIHRATTFTNMVFDDSRNYKDRLKAARGMMEDMKEKAAAKKQKYKDIDSAFPCFSSTDLQKFNKHIESELLTTKNEEFKKGHGRFE
jgi:hypothetical protein